MTRFDFLKAAQMILSNVRTDFNRSNFTFGQSKFGNHWPDTTVYSVNLKTWNCAYIMCIILTIHSFCECIRFMNNNCLNSGRGKVYSHPCLRTTYIIPQTQLLKGNFNTIYYLHG